MHSTKICILPAGLFAESDEDNSMHKKMISNLINKFSIILDNIYA